MSVTIKDVAKRANVSPSTVSRVLSDSSKISDKTKKKVRKTMDELGYHINFNARVLVQKSTKAIGIVMKHSASQSMQNPFFPEILRGISAFCHKKEYSISLTTGESEQAIFEEVIKMVQGKRVDGLIVLYSKEDDQVVPYLLEQKIPFVVIGKPASQSNQMMYVDNDNVQAAKEATEFLIQLGHERIGFIGDDPTFQVMQDRLNGYREGLLTSGLEVIDAYVKDFIYGTDRVKQIIDELVALTIKPTAIVISADVNAFAVMKELRERGITVPEQMSIISFNNTILSQFSIPPMTAVDIQTYQLGYEASRCVIELIHDTEMFKHSVIIPTIIKVRESTCIPKIAET
ncbi:DNA-binding LacI/PurR family transcriptional regulator [Alkalihalobacillus xiaoxiensis]|uniref:DNA-binding LacI/PurR family transcriptional regulator n=2 Tax=Shouchella xiaoxiensis TaxID=766895 RepID=A0ABS2SVS0_9BACI|nr:DNA-binding LacI/PurR family transcriptional regulator [Shouchella xiaoxiensis]